MGREKAFRVLDRLLLLLFWLYVIAPLTWGIWSTLQKSFALFK
jgi:hypothetical protein